MVRKTYTLLLLCPGVLLAGGIFDLSNRAGVVWDSNVDQTPRNETSSLVFINDLEMAAEHHFYESLLSLRYRPILEIIQEDDDTADAMRLHQSGEIEWFQPWGDSLELRLREAVRFREKPEVRDGEELLRRRLDRTDHAFTLGLGRRRAAPGEGRQLDVQHAAALYRDKLVDAERGWQSLGLAADRDWSLVTAQVRLTHWEVEDDIRTQQSLQIGLNWDHALTPRQGLQMRGGWELRRHDLDEDLENAPYVDIGWHAQGYARSTTALSLSWAPDMAPDARYWLGTRLRARAELSRALGLNWRVRADAFVDWFEANEDTATTEVPAASASSLWGVSLAFHYQFQTGHSLILAARYRDADNDFFPEESFEQSRVSLSWRAML